MQDKINKKLLISPPRKWQRSHTLEWKWFLGVGWDWVHLVRRPLIGLLYQPRMTDNDECGEVNRMRIGRGNRSTRSKPAPVSLCPPQIPHDLTGRRCGKPATNHLSYGHSLGMEVTKEPELWSWKNLDVTSYHSGQSSPPPVQCFKT
jgi:hypothetical protein